MSTLLTMLKAASKSGPSRPPFLCRLAVLAALFGAGWELFVESSAPAVKASVGAAGILLVAVWLAAELYSARAVDRLAVQASIAGSVPPETPDPTAIMRQIAEGFGLPAEMFDKRDDVTIE
jgi:hypothetical protein